MIKIDTEYTSLSEIDPEITPFYSEDVRTRITGYTEPDEDGISEPIIEEYTVIVLNKPDEVTYEYVESRRGRRLPKEVIDQAITDAIAWEDFAVNHDGYLDWLNRPTPERARSEDGTYVSDDPDTTENEAWVDGFTQEDYDAQERPVINMANRRDVYHSLVQSHERDRWVPTEEIIIEVDDETYTITEHSVGASDETWAEFEANPSPEYVKYLKLKGIEFEGVMCSATKTDYWGLGVAFEAIKVGLATKWNFENGNTLVLTPDNIEAFKAVWLPFRMSFFDTDFE